MRHDDIHVTDDYRSQGKPAETPSAEMIDY